jgi:hypothetical protein
VKQYNSFAFIFPFVAVQIMSIDLDVFAHY